MNTTSVDAYLRDGCGRCDHYRTPACKVHRWRAVLEALRELLLSSGLVEEMKWGSPCYTLNGKIVVMLSALTDYVALSFFKGAALADEAGVLERPGPNTRLSRVLKFRSGEDVMERHPIAAKLVQQAIEVERAGIEVERTDAPEPLPLELEQRLAVDSELRRAFESLTPGRRRSHVLYIGGAKKSETRASRVERCVPKIAAGKGFDER